MGVGMDVSPLGSCPEEACSLDKTLLLGLGSIGQIFAVGLGLSGKGLFQICFGLGHRFTLPSYMVIKRVSQNTIIQVSPIVQDENYRRDPKNSSMMLSVSFGFSIGMRCPAWLIIR